MKTSRWLAAAAFSAIVMVSAPASAQTSHPLGNVVTVPAVKVEPHPTLEHVGNWEAILQQLQHLASQPASDDAAVIAAIQALGSKAPPPLLMELGSRLSHTDLEQGRYWFMKGIIQTKLSLLACEDTSATAAFQIVATVVMQEWQARPNPMMEPDNQYKGYAQALNNGATDLSVSPWWACSHGMKSMIWGMQEPDKVRSLSEWYVGDEKYNAARDEYVAGLRSFLAEQDAQ